MIQNCNSNKLETLLLEGDAYVTIEPGTAPDVSAEDVSGAVLSSMLRMGIVKDKELQNPNNNS